MMLDTREMISVTEANQNFSRATRIADQRGKAVILKGNRPKYVLLDIEADPRLLLSDDELIGISATRIFKNHRERLRSLQNDRAICAKSASASPVPDAGDRRAGRSSG